MPNYADLDDFTVGYVDCALWLADPHQYPGEYTPDGDDFNRLSENDRVRITDDCRRFQEQCADALAFAREIRPDFDDFHAGHNFYLTRNGHGAGFWDRGLGVTGERLTDAACAFGASELSPMPCGAHSPDECDCPVLFILE